MPPRKEAWEPPAMPSEESRAARPRLNLKPRSQKVGEGGNAAGAGGSSSIFGQAKPIDTTAKLAALDLKAEKAKTEKAEKAKVEKAKVEKAKVEKAEKVEKAKVENEEEREEAPKAPKATLVVLKAEKANPTKLANPFDLLGEE